MSAESMSIMVLKGRRSSLFQVLKEPERKMRAGAGGRAVRKNLRWLFGSERLIFRERRRGGGKGCDMLCIHASISTEKLLLGGVSPARRGQEAARTQVRVTFSPPLSLHSAAPCMLPRGGAEAGRRVSPSVTTLAGRWSTGRKIGG